MRAAFSRRCLLMFMAVVVGVLAPRGAEAHHEALFGPQSSLAVESQGFVSTQMHVHVTGSGSSYDRENTYILSAGIAPFPTIPWSFTLVQPVTYEAARKPTIESVGPFATCGGCFARENVIVSTSYRFDFTGLQRELGKDGNFALTSVSIEPPTGNMESDPLRGPFNYFLAGMAGLEWRALSAVALGYYRINGADNSGSKKGNNGLAGLGFAYTPLDERDRMVSFQLGIAAELHARDVLDGALIDASGGTEVFASPTIVWSPAERIRFFALVSLPFAQSFRTPAQEDSWRAGLGVIYSLARSEPAALGVTQSHPHGP